MESVTDARSNALFMASLAHAIRSRLNAVLGGLELVSQSPLPPEQARFISTAVEEGRSLLRLVNNALELGRAEAGQLQLEDQPLDPVAIAEGALGSTVAALHSSGVSVASVIDPQTPLTLRGDPARLRQVLVNLLDNARKATEHGSITLQLRPIRSDERGEHLCFEVSDTGRGVPTNLRKHLFSPMVPANGRADWGYTSLGLDLALCRLLVEQMGGSIEYEPRAGHGSTFRFTARFKRDVDFERLSDRIAEARDRRVVLVDSDSVRRTTFAKQGRQWGIRARVLADGKEVAVVLQGSQAVDLLLVHQDAENAHLALAAARGRRVAVLVPTGSRPLESLGAAHGAPIWLSAPMRRNSFLDALMGRPVPALASPDLEEPVIGGSRGRVLLVEDSEANRLILGAQLSRLGCTVDAVDNGAEAVRLVSQRRYGLVMTDLALPDMNGLEVAAEIRALPGKKGQVPIVAVSGGTHPSDRERCLAVGMNTFLSKPVAQRDLRQTLERWLPTREEAASGWDASALDALARDFGPARAANLVQAFVREVGQRVGRLGPDIAHSTDTMDLIRRESHALKSAARTFGAAALADCATDLESSCQSGAAERLGPLLEQLRREGQEAIDRSDEWIRQHEHAGEQP
jgi:CheY-like chemotaxis protein/HPt (histidine-containing phosphotransfer) domain-containing protein